ncbi:hypothetical protein AB0392_40945 [Nonomuraea angiospora]|uniref:hypothetical protein n=1 Tax=Nonomuraea angiospora TaxID=46172 RepID=UPI0034507327
MLRSFGEASQGGQVPAAALTLRIASRISAEVIDRDRLTLNARREDQSDDHDAGACTTTRKSPTP